MATGLGLFRAENIDRAASFVLIVLPRFPTRFGRRGGTNIGVQGNRFFVIAHYWFGWIVRFFVGFQHVLHPGDVLVIEFGHTPLFSRHGLSSWSRSSRRMFSLPTRGTNLRLAASSATKRTVRRRRVATHHRNGPLPLAGVEHRGSAWALLVTECGLQAALSVTMSNLADGLRGEGDEIGDLRSAFASSQLLQYKGAKDNPNLLDAAQQLGKLLFVPSRNVNAQSRTTHTASMGQNNFT